MTKFELGYNYPFTSLAFLLVLMLSGAFLHEPITVAKLIETALIMIVIVVASSRRTYQKDV